MKRQILCGIGLMMLGGTAAAAAWQIEVNAWDAGTEANDQNCLHIPGPRCGGEALSAPAATDEGYVCLSNGFHDLGDGTGEVLKPSEYTWNNPVALVTIKRIR